MKRTSLGLLVILLAGALLRVSYLREIVHAPDFASPLADAAFHDYWARAILDGDWTPPTAEANPRIPETPFQRPPGYPYFLALVYGLTGGSPLGVRLAQMALGLLNCVFAFFLGRALFSRGTGLAAAALCATYWIFPYYEGELHAPALIAALNLATVLALVAWARHPRGLAAFVSGLLLGTAALVQTNALLFAPFGALWMALGGRRLGLGGRAPVHAAVFLAGAALAIAPATARNWLVTDPHDFVLVGSNGAVNLYIGNNDEADGISVKIPNLQEIALMNSWSWFSYDRIVAGMSIQAGRLLKYSEASRVFRDRAIEFIRENPRRFLALCAKRAVLFWGPQEIANNKAVAVDKDQSPTLRRLPEFPWLLSFALAGAGALLVERRRVGASAKRAGAAASASPAHAASAAHSVALAGVGLFVLAYFLSFVPFLAAARFRAPILPIVFVFSAYALVRFAVLLRTGAWKSAALAAIVWLALFLAARHPFIEAGPDKAWWHTDRAAALVQEGKLDAAVLELQLALRENPGYVDAHVNLGGVLTELGRVDEAILHFEDVVRNRPDRNDVRLRLGSLLLRARRFDDAVRELEEVARVTPTSALAHFEYGRALLEVGRDDEGVAALRRSLELDPKQAPAHVNIGIVLARKGDAEGALAAYREALTVDPYSSDANFQIGRLAQDAGKFEEAEKSYQESFRLNPDTVEPPITIGNLYLEAGRPADAERWYRKAVGIDPRSLSARTNLAGSLANQGKFEEAVRELEVALQIDPKHAEANERMRILREYLASLRAPSAPPSR